MAKKEKTEVNESGSRGYTAYNVSAEDFIKAWETSETVDEACEKLAPMPKTIVLARASSYRTAGIKLKKMPAAGGRGLNPAKLNGLIEDIRRRLASGEIPEVGAKPTVDNSRPALDEERLKRTTADLLARVRKK